MISRSNFRSIDGIFTVFSSLKNQATGQVDKPLKNALYNVGLLILLATFAGVITILLPFMRPLLWGGLFGAVLFPAKKRIAEAMREWLQKLEDTETNVVYGIVAIPFNTMDYVGRHIIFFIVTHIKIILILSSSLITLRLLVNYLPKNFLSLIWRFLELQHSLIGKVGTLSILMIVLLIVVYAIIVHIMWDDSTKSTFTICGQFFWIFIIGYICSFCGPLQVPVFIAIMVYSIAGYFYHKNNSSENQVLKENENENNEKVPLASSRLTKTKNQLSELKNRMQLNVNKDNENGKSQELESDFYFKLLFYACTATLIWTHLWIVFLCFIPVSYYAIKYICNATGLWDYLEFYIGECFNKTNQWLDVRKNAIMPVFLPGVIQLNRKLHKLFCVQMKTYVDDISSVFMIIFLIVSLLSLSIFLFFQIYSEAITVAQLGGNLVNRTLTLRPDLVETLPINIQSMNDILDNAYKYGRSTLDSHLDSFLNGTDPEQAEKLKSSIISIWDRLVQSYMDQSNGDDSMVGPRVTTESVLDTLDEIVTSSNITYSGIMGWAKSNVAVLKDVGNSLWVVLRTNLTLLASGITTFFGMLIGSGSYMIAFLLNTVNGYMYLCR
jgi:ABC-type multidrug transport system fused ATPase/permease subunit